MDYLICNGRIIDPANEIDEIMDLKIENGKITARGKNLKTSSNFEVFDAAGYIVTPGLIDCHAHVYEYATPLGVNPDKYCLSRGVTTVVDAGSAGASTFPGLKKFIAEPSTTCVLSLLHIASHGLAAAGCANTGASTFPGLKKFIAEPSTTHVLSLLHIASHGLAAIGCQQNGSTGSGECDSLKQVDPALCRQCIEANPDMIVGVKIRLTADVCNDGMYEEEAYRRALEVSRETKLPLMIHRSFSSIKESCSDGHLTCPGEMKSGDIYTHCFHGFPSSIIDPQTRQIFPEFWAAKRRGVLFDIGHGQGSFSWTVAEICAKSGFWPDMIGSDLHIGNIDGPAYDLITIMTKILNLGMPLAEVIKAATATPAKAFGRSGVIGCLSVGAEADVTVIREDNVDISFEDAQSQVRKIKKRLVPVAVWKCGKKFDIKELTPCPNQSKVCAQVKFWDELVIRDDTRPTPEIK